MVVRMRSNVLKREEKGFGPVSFPRVLMAGFSGAFAILSLSRAMGIGVGCASGFLIATIVIVMTQPIGGVPLARHLVKVFQGMAVANAVKQARGEAASPFLSMVSGALNVNPEDGTLSCDEVFNVRSEEGAEEMEEGGFVFFRDISDLESPALQVLDNPFGSAQQQQ